MSAETCHKAHCRCMYGSKGGCGNHHYEDCRTGPYAPTEDELEKALSALVQSLLDVFRPGEYVVDGHWSSPTMKHLREVISAREQTAQARGATDTWKQVVRMAEKPIGFEKMKVFDQAIWVANTLGEIGSYALAQGGSDELR
jgi:hypothetical protein